MMVLITEWIENKKIRNTFAIFGIITVIATILEYLASFLLESAFKLRWWDYTGYFLNINGRVCLVFSVFFGIAGIVFIKKIYPVMQKMVKKIREKISVRTIWIVLIVLIIIMTLDKGISALRYIDPTLQFVDKRVIIQPTK